MKNLPDDLTNKVYDVLEKASSTGKVKKGTNEVTKAVERGTAKLVVIAEDVDPKAIVAHLPILCEEKKIALVQIPSKKELGASIKLKVGCASAAVINEGNERNAFKEVLEQIQLLKKKENTDA